jgi:hypothetical protein
MAAGQLTALQLNVAAGLLQNQGIGVNADLISAINSYESTALIAPLLDVVASSNITANVVSNVESLGANTCSALSNSVPVEYSDLGNQMTTVILAQASLDICGNNASQLAQAVNQAEGYAGQTTVFVNSAINSQTYLGGTFTSMNNTLTGDISSVNLATPAFGADLAKLGKLINLADLGNFGSPLGLVRQIYAVAGTVPILAVAFIEAGIDQEVVLNLTNPTVTVIDSAQRIMYQVMTQITGNELNQILNVLQVTTPGINTMADLLNPIKLFPNSFLSLTAPTADGPRAIYINASGAVNTELITQLPPYVMSSLV